MRLEHQEKMIEVQNYKLKENQHEEHEQIWKTILANGSDLVKLSTNVNIYINEKKSLMTDCETSHENLEGVEKQLLEIQKSLNILKADISVARQKWEKNKTAREADLLEYTDKLKTLYKTTNEDDLVIGELDAK